LQPPTVTLDQALADTCPVPRDVRTAGLSHDQAAVVGWSG